MKKRTGALFLVALAAHRADGGSFWTRARSARPSGADLDTDGGPAEDMVVPHSMPGAGPRLLRGLRSRRPAASAVRFRKADVGAFKECIDRVADHPGGPLALMALFLYIQNIRADLSDPERRLVCLLSPTFTSCVGAVPGSLAALQAAGFTATHQAHDGTPYLLMPVANARQLALLDRELRERLHLPPGPVPAGFAQSQLPGARVGDAATLRDVLRSIKTAVNATRAMHTMLGYARAVKARPHDPRFRLVHMFNRQFLETVGSVPRGLDAMRALGFTATFQSADGSPFLVMPVVELSLLAQLERVLLDELPRAFAYDRVFGARARAAGRPVPEGAAEGAGDGQNGASADSRKRRGAAAARAKHEGGEHEGGGAAAGAGRDGEEEEDDALFADDDPAAAGDAGAQRAGGSDGGRSGLPADGGGVGGGAQSPWGGSRGQPLPLPPPEILLRALFAYAVETIVRLGLLRPQMGGGGADGAAWRPDGSNASADGGNASASGAGGAAGRQPPHGMPPPAVRVIFGRPPPGAIPLGSMDLPPFFGGPGGAGGNASAAGGPGGDGESEGELSTLEAKLKGAQLTADAREVATRELRRLRRMSPQHSDYSATFDYLEWIAEVPWEKPSNATVSVRRARAQLDADHCGLPKVKRRIVEFLAVTKLTDEPRGSILCLLGPPGVGKTSLGQSVAKALGRKFYRISLGGVHSEAEIRGHRRTYVGALPGLVMQAVRKCGQSDPVIMLDEVDKLGTRSLHGDPSSALLEVLDPEQNGAFRDHFLNTPFNLSRVLFLATANELDSIARPLLDRMETVELTGYTTEEKVSIARTHLLPKQLSRHGLGPAEIAISDELLQLLARRYTREAGLRELERKLAALCRAVAAEVAEAQADERDDDEEPPPPPPPERAHAAARANRTAAVPPALADRVVVGSGSPAGGTKALRSRAKALRRGRPNVPPPPHAETAPAAPPEPDGAAAARADPPAPPPAAARAPVQLTEEKIRAILGPEPYLDEAAERLSKPGVAMGLAYTAVGGDLLFIEASKMAGTGKVELTGRLGEVMRESAHTALSWIRSHALELGLVSNGSQQLLNGTDVHLHFPAGAVPKDGPSAGVTIASALVSMLRGVLCRSDTAMTGEITLRGHVLPVGGIKEKVVAAHRAGLRRVILPEKNRKDLSELPDYVRSDMQFEFATDVRDVLRHALEGADVDAAAGDPGAGGAPKPGADADGAGQPPAARDDGGPPEGDAPGPDRRSPPAIRRDVPLPPASVPQPPIAHASRADRSPVA